MHWTLTNQKEKLQKLCKWIEPDILNIWFDYDKLDAILAANEYVLIISDRKLYSSLEEKGFTNKYSNAHDRFIWQPHWDLSELEGLPFQAIIIDTQFISDHIKYETEEPPVQPVSYVRYIPVKRRTKRYY